MALNDPVKTHALEGMIEWVKTFSSDWFNYMERHDNGEIDETTVVEGVRMTFARTLQTTTSAGDHQSYMCFTASFKFPTSTAGGTTWRLHVWVYSPQEDPAPNRLAALDGLQRFLREQCTYTTKVYADKYV